MVELIRWTKKCYGARSERVSSDTEQPRVEADRYKLVLRSLNISYIIALIAKIRLNRSVMS